MCLKQIIRAESSTKSMWPSFEVVLTACIQLASQRAASALPAALAAVKARCPTRSTTASCPQGVHQCFHQQQGAARSITSSTYSNTASGSGSKSSGWGFATSNRDGKHDSSSFGNDGRNGSYAGGNEGSSRSSSTSGRCSSSGKVGGGRSCIWEETADLADLRHPALWFPIARSVNRRLIAHVGPTNSGKTHKALTALKAARSGIYCGPLRLLACEVAERLNAEGMPCHLVTGQEVKMEEGARHTAATVEMADVDTRYEVAVLDEVQMLADPTRGWSWTRALLGLPAKEVHLCGDPAALPLLRKLAADCGEVLEERSYKRLSPLIVQQQPLRGLEDVAPGDCVVAFSRKSLHRLRADIAATPWAEAYSSHHKYNSSSGGGGGAGDSGSGSGSSSSASASSTSCNESDNGTAPDILYGDNEGQEQQHRRYWRHKGRRAVGLVYGALPPDARRRQAALFNSGATSAGRGGYEVLVASDAVGMGLNLHIRRIVFATMHKFDGESMRPLLPTEVKQIAGRAGRFSSGHPEGYVTCLRASDIPLLIEAMGAPSPLLEQASLLPTFEQISLWHLARCAEGANTISGRTAPKDKDDSGRGVSFADSLESLCGSAQTGAPYKLGDTTNMVRIARLLEPLPLSDEELFTFALSPTDMTDPALVQALSTFASLYAFKRSVSPSCFARQLPLRTPRSETALKKAEEAYRVAELYCWLAGRFPGSFRGRDTAIKMRDAVSKLIDSALQNISMLHQHGAKEGHLRRGDAGNSTGQGSMGRDVEGWEGEGQQERKQSAAWQSSMQAGGRKEQQEDKNEAEEGEDEQVVAAVGEPVQHRAGRVRKLQSEPRNSARQQQRRRHLFDMLREELT